MAQKFFLFKRKDPAVSGGATISDNGKGISVISIPSTNLAYMAASKGAVTMFFNNSAPFEENSFTTNGESFEKTSVTVSCDVGEESQLMEDIINFINRDTAKNVMKFDATGSENTFGDKSAKRVIDTKVRARPVERGVVGDDAIVTGLDANALVGATGAINTQIDFIKTTNKPVFDIGGEQIPASVDDGASVTSLTGGNRGTETSYGALTFTNVICKESLEVCKTKTLGFDVFESLKIADLVGGPTLTETNLDADQTAAKSSNVLVSRDSNNISSDISLPRFELTTDGSGVATSLDVVYGGSGIKAGDVISIAFNGDSDGLVQFTVRSNDMGGGITNRSGVFFDRLYHENFTLDTPQPHETHTIYMVLVRPHGALLNPVYSSKPTSPSPPDDFTFCMGPFPVESKEDEFQFNFNVKDQIFEKIKSGITKATEAFSKFIKSGSQKQSPEDNLIVLVINKDSQKNVTVYDKFGEIVAVKESGPETDGSFFFSRVGMVTKFEQEVPQLRVARFGVVPKSLDDFTCRSIATQLHSKYKA